MFTEIKELREKKSINLFPKKERLLMAFEMSDSQQVTLSINFTDKRGNPVDTPSGSSPEYSTDNTDLLRLTPSTDGMSCLVQAVGPLGSGVVTVKVADSSGNPLAAGSIDVTIKSGAPTSINITPGTVEEQP